MHRESDTGATGESHYPQIEAPALKPEVQEALENYLADATSEAGIAALQFFTEYTPANFKEAIYLALEAFIGSSVGIIMLKKAMTSASSPEDQKIINRVIDFRPSLLNQEGIFPGLVSMDQRISAGMPSEIPNSFDAAVGVAVKARSEKDKTRILREALGLAANTEEAWFVFELSFDLNLKKEALAKAMQLAKTAEEANMILSARQNYLGILTPELESSLHQMSERIRKTSRGLIKDDLQ